MKPLERIELLEGCESLLIAQRRDHRTVISKLDEYSGELSRGGGTAPIEPAEGSDEGNARDYSDRTGELALRVDPFHKARRDYDQLLTQVHSLLVKADRIRLMATSRVKNEDQASPCQSCARIEDTATGKSMYVPAYREASSLCKWCGDYLRDHGKWPLVLILEVHLRGQRVSVQMIDKAERAAKLSA